VLFHHLFALVFFALGEFSDHRNAQQKFLAWLSAVLLEYPAPTIRKFSILAIPEEVMEFGVGELLPTLFSRNLHDVTPELEEEGICVWS
jgi:hypothetical protein